MHGLNFSQEQQIRHRRFIEDNTKLKTLDVVAVGRLGYVQHVTDGRQSTRLKVEAKSTYNVWYCKEGYEELIQADGPCESIKKAIMYLMAIDEYGDDDRAQYFTKLFITNLTKP